MLIHAARMTFCVLPGRVTEVRRTTPDGGSTEAYVDKRT